MANLQAEVGFGATLVAVKAQDTAEKDGVVFEINVTGSGGVSGGDLLGFFLDIDPDKVRPILSDFFSLDGSTSDKWFKWDNEKILSVGSMANNMNGVPQNAGEDYVANTKFDIGVQLSDPGAADGNLETIQFTIKGLTTEDLEDQRFGIRLQNTPNAENSLKLVGELTPEEDPKESLVYAGYTKGRWKNEKIKPASGIDALFNDNVPTFEELIYDVPIGTQEDPITGLTFAEGGVEDPDIYNNATIRDALRFGGGGLNQLAGQATAAYLNALYFGQDTDADPLIDFQYKVTTENIKKWTKDVIGSDYSGNGTANLTGLFWYLDSNGNGIFGDVITASNGDVLKDALVSGGTANNLEDVKNLFDYWNHMSEGSPQPSEPLVV